MEEHPSFYDLVRSQIHDGDLLLFRHGQRLLGRLIATAGRSEYTHAGMAAWWNGRLMCLDTVQGRGGQAVLLSNLVKKYPGQIDVYTAGANGQPFDRQAAVEAMMEITGHPYGWLSLLWVALVHLAVVRLFVRPNTNDTSNGSLPFCSQAVSRACRAGGVDPVPNLADRLTEPGDLARSRFYSFLCTLE